MKIQIHVDETLNPVVEEHVWELIETRLAVHQRSIKNVHVTVVDTNGPKGGHDMRCRLRVQLLDSRELIIEETSDNVGRAIRTAIARTKHAVARSRHRSKTRNIRLHRRRTAARTEELTYAGT